MVFDFDLWFIIHSFLQLSRTRILDLSSNFPFFLYKISSFVFQQTRHFFVLLSCQLTPEGVVGGEEPLSVVSLPTTVEFSDVVQSTNDRAIGHYTSCHSSFLCIPVYIPMKLLCFFYHLQSNTFPFAVAFQISCVYGNDTLTRSPLHCYIFSIITYKFLDIDLEFHKQVLSPIRDKMYLLSSRFFISMQTILQRPLNINISGQRGDHSDFFSFYGTCVWKAD